MAEETQLDRQQPHGSCPWQEPERARGKLIELFDALVNHHGFGEMHISMKILKQGKKEIILSCGQEYRFVLKPAYPAKTQEGGD